MTVVDGKEWEQTKA